MAIAFVTVADSISKMSVSGVTIKDLDEIPSEVGDDDVPMIIPAPNFIGNFRPERVDLSTQEQDLFYTLNYRLLASTVGMLSGVHEAYPIIVAKLGLFFDALLINHDLTGLIDLGEMTPTSFGVVQGPSGKSFFGCNIAIEVMEFK